MQEKNFNHKGAEGEEGKKKRSLLTKTFVHLLRRCGFPSSSLIQPRG
jgi:hypothetical protein